jgi:hypothetical protein
VLRGRSEAADQKVYQGGGALQRAEEIYKELRPGESSRRSDTSRRAEGEGVEREGGERWCRGGARGRRSIIDF